MIERDLRRLTQLLRLPEPQLAECQDELLELVYRDLHRIAEMIFRSEAANHTLQPTAIVHEAWMRLGLGELEFRDRGHFYAVAARAMRQLLVDHARRRQAAKRQAGLRVTLSADLAEELDREVDVLELDRALTRLGERYERQARVAEMRYLAGLEVEHVGEALGISEKTVRRDWRFARSWLQRELGGPGLPES